MSRIDFPQEMEAVQIVPADRPAGFWIRAVASLVDALVLLPITVISFFAFLSYRSLSLVLLLYIPGLVYKPLMESRYGATLGKMACGIQVLDEHGRRLTLAAAYVRFSPWLAQIAVSLVITFWLFSNPQMQAVSGFLELGRLMQQSPANLLNRVISWVIIIDCVTAAFTARKRAVHDMLAGSYCVWKPAKSVAATDFF